MDSQVRTGSLPMLPLEYWEIESSIHGALIDNFSADGLLMLSARDMAIGTKLNVRIFYANEYELDGIEVVANIASKGLHVAEDWKGYKYGLEFVRISEEDRLKLSGLFNSDSTLEHISGRQDLIPGESSLTKTTLPLLIDSDSPGESNAKCKFYQHGKCLKTRAFCDLCQNEDDINLVEERRTIQKWKRHSSSPFTPILSKLSNSFTSTFRNH